MRRRSFASSSFQLTATSSTSASSCVHRLMRAPSAMLLCRNNIMHMMKFITHAEWLVWWWWKGNKEHHRGWRWKKKGVNEEGGGGRGNERTPKPDERNARTMIILGSFRVIYPGSCWRNHGSHHTRAPTSSRRSSMQSPPCSLQVIVLCCEGIEQCCFLTVIPWTFIWHFYFGNQHFLNPLICMKFISQKFQHIVI